MKKNNLVLVTSGVLVAAAILEEKKRNSTGTKKDQNRLARRLIAIALLAIVLTITVDQVPEFGGPFTLLVLVVALVGSSGIFSSYFKETQTK